MNLYNLNKNLISTHKIQRLLIGLVKLSFILIPIVLIVGVIIKATYTFFIVYIIIGIIVLLIVALFVVTKSIEAKHAFIIKTSYIVNYTKRTDVRYENSYNLTSCTKGKDVFGNAFYKVNGVEVPMVFVKELDENIIYLYPENSMDNQKQVNVLCTFTDGYCLVQDENENKMITHSKNLVVQ